MKVQHTYMTMTIVFACLFVKKKVESRKDEREKQEGKMVPSKQTKKKRARRNSQIENQPR